MLALGSLFDGIGGFPLAAAHHGIWPAWASEIEEFPIQVTEIRFPEMKHVGDITKQKGAELPPVDIIRGGSPCGLCRENSYPEDSQSSLVKQGVWRKSSE